jgi:hypothetical protein
MAHRRVGLVGFVAPSKWMRSHALYRGFLGGSKSWVVIGVFLYAPKLTKQLFGRVERVVATERLLPGQFVRIEALGPLSKAERKAIRKAK